MSLVRAIVKWSLCHTFNINAVHVTSDKSGIADSISRKQRQGFKLLVSIAYQLPIAVYTGFLNLLPANWIVYSMHHRQWIR